MEWVGALVRLVVSALVLMFVGAILPGFEPLGFWNALLAAAVIAAVGWVVEATMGKNISPYSRGDSWISGFGHHYLGRPVRRTGHVGEHSRSFAGCLCHWNHRLVCPHQYSLRIRVFKRRSW